MGDWSFKCFLQVFRLLAIFILANKHNHSTTMMAQRGSNSPGKGLTREDAKAAKEKPFF